MLVCQGESPSSPASPTDTLIAFYPNNKAVRTSVVRPVRMLWESQGHRHTIMVMRQLFASGDRERFKEMKVGLPSGTPSSASLDRGNDPRDTPHPKSKPLRGDEKCAAMHTGLIVLDVDGVEDAAAVRDEMARWRYVAASWVSPSGQGVKALVKLAQAPLRLASTKPPLPRSGLLLRRRWDYRWTILVPIAVVCVM